MADIIADTSIEKEISKIETGALDIEPQDKPLYGKRSKSQMAIDFAIFAALTAYIVAFILNARGKDGFELTIIVYVFLSLRLLARHVSVSQVIYRPIKKLFKSTIGAAVKFIPEKFRVPLLFAVTFIGLLICALTGKTDQSVGIPQRLQSLAGIIIFLALMYATSSNKKAIPWNTVAAGLLLQFLIALFVLKSSVGFNIFKTIANLIVTFLEFSTSGMTFIIGEYKKNNFALNVFPAIIFFCSFIYIVYYFGGMQYAVAKMAVATKAVLDCSGSEAIVAAASPFIGQGESALLVKPFVEYMTNSEIHAIMTSGFATIAGSVFLAYVSLGINASLLLTACVMSIPASLLLSKMRYPETEESMTKGKIRIPNSEEKEANFLHAAGNGAATGVQIVLLIFGSVLALVSLLALADAVVGFMFSSINVYDTVTPTEPAEGPGPKQVTISFIFSYIFYPFALFLGIDKDQARLAGAIMAEKMIVNEFVAYLDLSKDIAREASKKHFSERTFQLLSFALCGFANVSSIGIQIGTLGAIAPSRARDFANLAVSAMLTGTISTWLTAAVAGVVL